MPLKNSDWQMREFAIYDNNGYTIQSGQPVKLIFMSHIPFQTIDWSSIEKTEHKGETGISFWQTVQLEGLRLRIVEYSPGYFADHWCRKGHFVHCLSGSFVSELSTGEKITLSAGMSYIVSDELSSHRSSTAGGVKLLIIDGDFLKLTSPTQ